LHRSNIAPLTAFVEQLRREYADRWIPYFDPTEAGVGAKVLLLLEAPGARSALGQGSGFVSPDNNDQTASNMWQLLQEAELDRAVDVVTWNVVPWYLGDGERIRAARIGDLREARPATEELLGLLTELRVAVLLGKPASKAWAELGPDIDVIEAPHPSPLNLNTRPQSRAEILEALVEAKRRAERP
jgi:uracil-DNA glycosylase